MDGTTVGAAADRRAFVDFVRTHHPDVGGDPEVFRAGLAAFQAEVSTGQGVSSGPAGPVEIHRRHRGPRAVWESVFAARRRRRRPPRVR